MRTKTVFPELAPDALRWSCPSALIPVRSADNSSFAAGPVVFTSSFGASCYMHGPGYGAQKVGVDKFAKDMTINARGGLGGESHRGTRVETA